MATVRSAVLWLAVALFTVPACSTTEDAPEPYYTFVTSVHQRNGQSVATRNWRWGDSDGQGRTQFLTDRLRVVSVPDDPCLRVVAAWGDDRTTKGIVWEGGTEIGSESVITPRGKVLRNRSRVDMGAVSATRADVEASLAPGQELTCTAQTFLVVSGDTQL